MNLSCGRSYGSIPSTKRASHSTARSWTHLKVGSQEKPSNVTLLQSEQYAVKVLFPSLSCLNGGTFVVIFFLFFGCSDFLDRDLGLAGTFQSLSDPPESLEDPKRGRKKSRKWRALLWWNKKESHQNERQHKKRESFKTELQPIWQPRTYRWFLVWLVCSGTLTATKLCVRMWTNAWRQEAQCHWIWCFTGFLPITSFSPKTHEDVNNETNKTLRFQTNNNRQN